MMLACLALLAAGLATLATAQASERRRRGKPPLLDGTRKLRRTLGTALLAAALAAAVLGLGIGFGLIFWTLALGLTGLLLATGQGVLADRAGWHEKPARRRRRAGR